MTHYRTRMVSSQTGTGTKQTCLTLSLPLVFNMDDGPRGWSDIKQKIIVVLPQARMLNKFWQLKVFILFICILTLLILTLNSIQAHLGIVRYLVKAKIAFYLEVIFCWKIWEQKKIREWKWSCALSCLKSFIM